MVSSLFDNLWFRQNAYNKALRFFALLKIMNEQQISKHYWKDFKVLKGDNGKIVIRVLLTKLLPKITRLPRIMLRLQL